jgi:hypothetical protein
MKKYLLAASFGVTACHSSSLSYPNNQPSAISEYEDGEYCAEVHYYNPKTRTSSDYTLTVSVEGNELTVIHFRNGGWLDDSHFDPPDISDGTVTITDDRAREYEIAIIKEGKCD